jgi:hypothetical protein
MKLTTKYQGFWTRLRKEFLLGFLIVSIIILFNYLARGHGDIRTPAFMILAFAFAYGLISLSNAKTYINELNFLDDKLIVVGHDYDSPWEKQFSIKNSNIKINSKGRGRGKVGYYFTITSGDLKVEINRSFNWDYSTLLIMFNEFKRVKNEKIIFDEKYFLDIMEKKSKGLG